MAFLHFDTGTTIRKFSVAGGPRKTVVTVEFEVSDPRSLGYLITYIGEAQAELAAAARPEPASAPEPRAKAKSRATNPARPKAIARQAPLALTYLEDL